MEALCQDIKKVPLKKSRAATHFKCLKERLKLTDLESIDEQKRRIMNSITDEEQRGKSMKAFQDALYQLVCPGNHLWDNWQEINPELWTPCTPTENGAVLKTFSDFKPNEIQLAPLTPLDLIKCADARKPSIDVDSVDGPVKICELYHEQCGQTCGQTFSFEEDATFDASDCLSSTMAKMNEELADGNQLEKVQMEIVWDKKLYTWVYRQQGCNTDNVYYNTLEQKEKERKMEAKVQKALVKEAKSKNIANGGKPSGKNLFSKFFSGS